MSKEAEDRIYYARRAMQERDRAECSGEAAIASVHRKLAEEYEGRARGLPARLKVTA